MMVSICIELVLFNFNLIPSIRGLITRPYLFIAKELPFFRGSLKQSIKRLPN